MPEALAGPDEFWRRRRGPAQQTSAEEALVVDMARRLAPVRPSTPDSPLAPRETQAKRRLLGLASGEERGTASIGEQPKTPGFRPLSWRNPVNVEPREGTRLGLVAQQGFGAGPGWSGARRRGPCDRGFRTEMGRRPVSAEGADLSGGPRAGRDGADGRRGRRTFARRRLDGAERRHTGGARQARPFRGGDYPGWRSTFVFQFGPARGLRGCSRFAPTGELRDCAARRRRADGRSSRRSAAPGCGRRRLPRRPPPPSRRPQRPRRSAPVARAGFRPPPVTSQVPDSNARRTASRSLEAPPEEGRAASSAVSGQPAHASEARPLPARAAPEDPGRCGSGVDAQTRPAGEALEEICGPQPGR